MNKDEKIAFEIKMLDNMISRKIFNSCKKNNMKLMSHVQASIIRYIYVNRNSNVYQSDLEKEMNVRRSTMSGILDTMEKNNFIKRISSDKDARKKQIVLTEETVLMHNKMKKGAEEFDKLLVKNISSEDLEAFHRVVNIIKKNIEEEEHD